MSENKEARELAVYKAKTDLSAMLKSEESTPYELIKKKLEDLHFDLIQQSAESAAALSEMQSSYQDQINALKKQLLRREVVHKEEIAVEQRKFNQMVLDYTNIIEDLNRTAVRKSKPNINPEKMKLHDAKEIISYILDWQFVCMGVKDKTELSKTLDLSKYTLNDLVLANQMVKANNARKKKLAEFHRAKGHKVKGISISMILADRAIAAVYTAMSFPPNGEMIALINDVGVGCVRAKYKK